MLNRGMLPNKTFMKIRWVYLSQASITKKELLSKYFFSWVTAWIREKFKINWISLGIYFRANNSKQYIKIMRDKIETVFQYWDKKTIEVY